VDRHHGQDRAQVGETETKTATKAEEARRRRVRLTALNRAAWTDTKAKTEPRSVKTETKTATKPKKTDDRSTHGTESRSVNRHVVRIASFAARHVPVVTRARTLTLLAGA
jgi:hypothetical protein